MDYKLMDEINDLINKHNVLLNQNLSRSFNQDKNLSGLGFYQYQVLLMIYYFGNQNIGDLSRSLNIPSSNITRIANSLVERELCAKYNIKGRKAVYLCVTEKGKALFEEERKANRGRFLTHFNKQISPEKQIEMRSLYTSLIELWSGGKIDESN